MEKSFREAKSHMVILILVVLCIALAGAGIYGWVENLALRAAVEELVTEPGEYDPDEGMVYSLAMYDLDSMYVFYGDLYVLAEDAAKEPENQQRRLELQYKLEGIAMARSRPAWPIIYSNFIRVCGDGDEELEDTVRVKMEQGLKKSQCFSDFSVVAQLSQQELEELAELFDDMSAFFHRGSGGFGEQLWARDFTSPEFTHSLEELDALLARQAALLPLS